MAYKQKGSPFQRNFKIGSPAKQMLKPRVAPTAAPMGAPAAPPPPPVDPAMVAQAAEAVKGAMAPPPADPGAEIPPPMQRNLRMESPVKKAVKGAMALQSKSGGKLVDFFKNAGKKIKAAGVKHQTWRDSRAKASADANAAGGGFKKFQADAAKMRKKGKSIFELQKIDAAAQRAKNKKNEQDVSSSGPEMNENMA